MNELFTRSLEHYWTIRDMRITDHFDQMILQVNPHTDLTLQEILNAYYKLKRRHLPAIKAGTIDTLLSDMRIQPIILGERITYNHGESVTVRVPFKGPSELLQYNSGWKLDYPIHAENNQIIFLIVRGGDYEEIIDGIKRIVEFIQSSIAKMNNQILSYNNALKERIPKMWEERMSHHLSLDRALKLLGYERE